MDIPDVLKIIFPYLLGENVMSLFSFAFCMLIVRRNVFYV